MPNGAASEDAGSSKLDLLILFVKLTHDALFYDHELIFFPHLAS